MTDWNKTCWVCGGPIVQPERGRPRKTCSDPCRKQAYTLRKAGFRVLRERRNFWIDYGRPSEKVERWVTYLEAEGQ